MSINKPNGTIDTMRYDNLGTKGTTFGFSAQDIGVQWFVAPCDLTIKGIGFNLSENAGMLISNAGFDIKVVKVKWTEAQLKAQKDEYIGYYNAAGNGYNDITGFPSNPDYTGGWVAGKVGAASPFDSTDFWSDGGYGFPESDYTLGFHWIPTLSLGEPKILAGEIFGIVFKCNGAINSDRNGLKAGELGFPGWKFYGNGRSSIADKGWWTRTYTWDMRALVELTGDRAPVIVSYDKLGTTLSTSSRTVKAVITDDNPSGGPAGVASAILQYTIDKGVTWSDVAMTPGADNSYSCDIPGQVPGTTVTYKIVATDVNANSTTSGSVTYLIYLANPLNPTLVAFSGPTVTTGYPRSYYFGYNGNTGTASEVITFPRDRWAFGALTKELVDHYTNIILIATGGPKDIDTTVIRDWLAASPSHNFLLAGDEYLGTITGWVNTTYTPGSFQYDILGVAKDYNDINYLASGDQLKASVASGV
ncbi:MAG: hypothetical protein Q8S01_08440, partial [Ignavibacteria bacterium]|nr:hypothetical protein [Ignavibacteria bacterium]